MSKPLTPKQGLVMEIVREHGPMSLHAVAEKYGCPPNNLRYTVDYLARRGLLFVSGETAAFMNVGLAKPSPDKPSQEPEA